MKLPHDEIDPNGLLEYSVVFTDRALNHMSQRFIGVMQELLDVLTTTYGATTAAVVPGGGTAAMESVARQLATGKRCLVVRNGFFSYRWSQIFERGPVTDDVVVCTARQIDDSPQAPWIPAPVEEVTDAIRTHRPEVVCAAHVETAAGLMLPEDYLRAVAEATHEVGGLFVLDCVASGAIWVDMREVGVDVLISAPQKGWSGTPAAGFVMLGERGREAVLGSVSTSFALDLRAWLSIAEGYAEGRAGYHSTMPTDTLVSILEQMKETRDRGLDAMRAAQEQLGGKVRARLAEHGLRSVAHPDYASPSVVVSYTDDPEVKSGAAFKRYGIQAAAGVPLMCGEPEGFSTFRLGLFGLDKLQDIDGTVQRLGDVLDKIADQGEE